MNVCFHDYTLHVCTYSYRLAPRHTCTDGCMRARVHICMPKGASAHMPVCICARSLYVMVLCVLVSFFFPGGGGGGVLPSKAHSPTRPRAFTFILASVKTFFCEKILSYISP